MAMRAQPKYAANFKHFEYANPNAPKGGNITLATTGAFDTLNPYSAKGTASILIGYANVFETLTKASLDEPFTRYGLLAESMELAPNALGITFHLNPKAQWSDGKPVTPDDVIFSFELLTSEKSQPFFRSYYADVKSVKKLGERDVEFTFKQKNAELHLILGELPILPKHFYENGDFGKDFTKKVLGSGPYVIKNFEFNKFVQAEKNPTYWGKDLAVNKGSYNFDSINLKYFKNSDVMLMGLKSGEFDILQVLSSKQWAVDVTGEKFDKGCLKKENVSHKHTQGLQGFVMNSRRPLFQDRRVRKALAMALDFDWLNTTLFYKQYSPHTSFFENSELAATGLPSPDELKLLNPLKSKISAEVFTTQKIPLGKLADTSKREHLLKARTLLDEAGWKVKNGVLERDGKKFEFTVLLDDPGFLRIVEPYLKALRTLGIVAQSRVEDQSIYEQKVRRFDFDMIVSSFPQSESPGNEQRDFWHSSSATSEASQNLIGIQDAAVDSLVESVIRAQSRKELVSATRALDRVLWFNHYVVPHWYSSTYRMAYWNRFSVPEKLPPYLSPVPYYISFGWIDAAKEQALKNNSCK